MSEHSVSRRVDDLGRITLPVDFRAALGISPNTTINLSLDGRHIVLVVGEAPCALCGKVGCSTIIRGKCVCRDCISQIKNLD